MQQIAFRISEIVQQILAPTADLRGFGRQRSTALARISHHLTVKARHQPATTALRLLTVLNVGFKVRSHSSESESLSGARLVLTGLSRTSPRHVVRNAG